ncbi:hypothetical protein E2562_014908 [Oryza meyeriana var. granulata]|uniref:Uncharacterized protein n=1 Tax=Oryza meyeriana var. granulata TaxID=110450 RepID=A0A6G1EK67_9ORYZ|nr:hypothetical protein E2562_014908 [Oryza meyeriana var. granulata]
MSKMIDRQNFVFIPVACPLAIRDRYPPDIPTTYASGGELAITVAVGGPGKGVVGLKVALHALLLLLSSPPSLGPSPASRDLLVRTLWELRRDPDAAALVLRWGEECTATRERAGPQPPAEACPRACPRHPLVPAFRNHRWR